MLFVSKRVNADFKHTVIAARPIQRSKVIELIISP